MAAAAGAAVFFRDPERLIIPIRNGVLSPADGRVTRIDTIPSSASGDALGGDELREITIGIGPLDCHVVRCPVDGRIGRKTRCEGSISGANGGASGEEVEIAFHGDVPVVLSQEAQTPVGHVITDVSVGDELEQGSRIGLLKFASQIKVSFPTDLKLLVNVGDKTEAGITALAARDLE